MVKKVTVSDNNIRIDRYIRKNILNNIPQSLLEKYLRRKLITLDGSKVFSSTQILRGQNLLIDDRISFDERKQREKHRVMKCNFNCPILYRDEHIIVLNKPGGVAVQRGSKVGTAISDILENFDKINNETPKIVHRLDKDTSGILMLARTLETARFLAELFANRKIEKIYRALVVGKPDEKTGKIEISLKSKFYNGQELVFPDENEGKTAITHFKLLEFFPEHNLSNMELRPITGRKHQLRAHMKYSGHSIYGDKKYGKTKAKLALHAYSLQLKLPGGKIVNVKAPLPGHMIINENLNYV
ncbi:MAG: RluA family pseudouridine synthase [Rickettsiaceae bacterium H1]|nr:RluA family pseudouridine synthase [Rickettsiaceae bacterium H1]